MTSDEVIKDEQDPPAPFSDEEARLVTAFADELMKRSINITPGSCVYFAGYLVDRAIKEGWVKSDLQEL